MTKEDILSLFAAYDEFRKRPIPPRGDARTAWLKEYGEFQTKIACAMVGAPKIKGEPPNIPARYVKAEQVSQ